MKKLILVSQKQDGEKKLLVVVKTVKHFHKYLNGQPKDILLNGYDTSIMQIPTDN